MLTPPRDIVEGGPESALPPNIRSMLDPTDPVRLAFKPSPWFVILRSRDALFAAALLVAIALGVRAIAPIGVWFERALIVAAVFVLARVIWSAIQWACRWYILTDRRAIRVAGVFRRTTSEIPRDSIRAAAMHESIAQRVVGLGTIGFATAGTGGYELVWSDVARPNQIRSLVPLPDPIEEDRPVPDQSPEPPVKPTVLGIAGGVGSGKSTVARAFERRGFLVSDSDAQTGAVLRSQEVKDQLRAWWGEGVIGSDGEVDRSAVARIVFASEDERRRLEGLIHPRLHKTRRALIARVGRLGAPGVIIDAPLLFEAGVDAECDAVVFVETPRETRLERVRASRGWDEAELDRREKAQMPLERKRERSDYVIINAGHADDLDREVSRVLEAIRTDRSPSDGR
ncbi:MAG: dephospho-CoA kinase [Phycisphaerales bacterium]